MKEALIDIHQPIIAYHETTEVLQPRKSPFNLPSPRITPHFATIMVFHMLVVFSIRANQFNTTFNQASAKQITVVAFVSNDASRIFPGSSSTRTWHRNFINRRLQQLHLTRRGRIEMSTDRDSLAIDHHHPLCTFSTFGLSDAGSPFFAEAKLSSAKVSSHSICFCSSSSDKNLRHIFSQTPCSSHFCKRRQQVLAEGYLSGRSFQRAPLRRTQMIPSRTSRLPLRLGPPLGDLLYLGRSGSSFCHCSSVINCSCLAIGVPFFMTKHT